MGKAPKKPETDAKKTEAAARSFTEDTKLSELTIKDLSSILKTQVADAVASAQITRVPDAQGVHVNSGPPGFVNGGGHANFDPGSLTSGAHVNSGPPGFVNGGGHANFDPASSGVHVNSGPPGFVNGGGHANFDPGSLTTGSHVNSGPPGFVNGGGHANFDPASSGVHVNSGPPGFVNGGGHANFDPGSTLTNPAVNPQVVNTTVTLPGGLKVDVPPGRFDMSIRGTRIKR